MNRNGKAAEDPTETESVLSAPLRGHTEAALEQLKARLLIPFLEKFRDASLVKEILWAANEAAALAWFTICPLLVLPILLEEKVNRAIANWEKQNRLLQSSSWKPLHISSAANASLGITSLFPMSGSIRLHDTPAAADRS